MKKCVFIRGIAPLAVCVLLLHGAASGQTVSFTATGHVNAVLAPGILCTNALGQVLVRGGVHTARIQATDARVTGQVFIIGDGNYHADGTCYWQGPAYLQVGTWDAAETNFTPTGGLWEGTWAGVMQTNYDLQVSIAGYGSGGTIDGWRLAETLIRTNATAPIDPNVPYLYSGTIKPPPVSTNLIFDDFATNVSGWGLDYWCGVVNTYWTNQAFGTRASWTNCPAQGMLNFFFAYRSRSWALADVQTLECQAHLIRMSENTTNGAMVWVGDYSSGTYGFDLSQAGVGLHKWTPATPNDDIYFWWDNTVHVARTNVVLCLALTRDKGNVILTTRVLDRANQNAVLFERSFADAPGVDATLTTEQFKDLTGITTFTLAPDSGAPVLSGGRGGVGMWQFTDGHQPPVEAIFDNFALRLHDEPPLSIAAAGQLTWTAPAGVNYCVLGGPTVQGPWLPVQELTLPGLQKQTAPLSGPAQFFRLVQAP
jgi:hypothetical protein